MVARFMFTSKINKEKLNFANLKLELLGDDSSSLIPHEIVESGLEKDGSTLFFKIKSTTVSKLSNGSIKLKILEPQEVCSEVNA